MKNRVIYVWEDFGIFLFLEWGEKREEKEEKLKRKRKNWIDKKIDVSVFFFFFFFFFF